MKEVDEEKILIWVAVIAIILVLGSSLAFGRDLGQWGNNDPKISEWYRELKQPDNPNASCCGEADAYWCDEIHVHDGHTFCSITDDREDGPRMRPHLAIGTMIPIPDNKLKWDSGNPDGHAIVFIGRPGYMNAPGTVYCFVQSWGG